MIRTLRLENYRGFGEYELRDLARVNLLVGPNDCGKTSVLEAVELLASRGHPDVLVESLRRRGESHAALEGDGRRAGTVRPFSLQIERGGDNKKVTLRLDEEGSIS